MELWNIRRSPKTIPNISEIYALLYRLGLTATCTGFFHTAYAVYLAVQKPECLLLVTKWLYPEVAKQYSTTWMCVERNIRTAVNIVWNTNLGLLEKIAGQPLPQKPKASKFISILAMHFTMNKAA